MILTLTKLKVCDNSGVKYVKCFKVYKTFFGQVGSLIYASIKESKNKDKYKRGDIVRGVIIRNKKLINRYTGNFISFDSNDVVLIDSKYDIIGTRVFGPLPFELRKKRHLKLLSLASSTV
jgi:large subunit ribosomal protein L14